jgi:tetratricopeptide (TPR) repeat protein
VTHRTKGLLLLIALVPFAFMRAVKADELDESPIPQILNCSGACINYVPAMTLYHNNPGFPRGQTGFTGVHSEGFVWLYFTVGVDGKTHDISKIYELGNPEFPRQTIEMVGNWTFQPASLNGKPVTEIRFLRQIFDAVTPGPPRQEILGAYQDASNLFSSGNAERARDSVESALQLPQLTFFERSMLALSLAKLAMLRQDYQEARRFSIMASVVGTKRMAPNLVQSLWETRIGADLMVGEYEDGFRMFNLLANTKGVDLPSSYTAQINAARASADAAPELVTKAKIPVTNEDGVYWHLLRHRTFQFGGDPGALDKFILSCDQRTLESKISLMALFHVPGSWTNCTVFVYGTAGTAGTAGAVFGIVETNDDKMQQDAAMTHYNDVVRSDPKNPNVYLGRAMAYAADSRWAEAISDYSTVIELDPKQTVAYQERARAYNAIGNKMAGLADAETVMAKDLKNYPARLARASLRRAVGKYDDALADYDVLIAGKSPLIYFNRAITLLCLGRYDEADEDFLKAIQRWGNDLPSYNWLHIVRAKRGKPDDQGYSAARSSLPNPNYVREIADLYRDRETIGQVEAAMNASRQDPAQKDNWPCSAKFFLGEYQLAHGEVAEAKAYFNEISPANCDYAEAAASVAELKRLH